MELSFEKLYEDHYNKLFNLAYRLMGNKEDAEDILQESFLNAYNAYDGFQNRSKVSTWLYRIVVNCAYKSMKKLKRLPVYEIATRHNMTKDEFFERLKTYESAEDEALTNDMREQCLQLFLKCIATKQRVAFVLKVLLELSAEDVSRIMEISVGAVKTNVYRARLRMKENMEDKCSYINPDSPCRCKNWVAYALENNRMDLIPKLDISTAIDYQVLYNKEMRFLSKIVTLYGKYPETQSYTSFIKRMRKIIEEKSLKILS